MRLLRYLTIHLRECLERHNQDFQETVNVPEYHILSLQRIAHETFIIHVSRLLYSIGQQLLGNLDQRIPKGSNVVETQGSHSLKQGLLTAQITDYFSENIHIRKHSGIANLTDSVLDHEIVLMSKT